jgi:hypothetical protein
MRPLEVIYAQVVTFANCSSGGIKAEDKSGLKDLKRLKTRGLKTRGLKTRGLKDLKRHQGRRQEASKTSSSDPSPSAIQGHLLLGGVPQQPLHPMRRPSTTTLALEASLNNPCIPWPKSPQPSVF